MAVPREPCNCNLLHGDLTSDHVEPIADTHDCDVPNLSPSVSAPSPVSISSSTGSISPSRSDAPSPRNVSVSPSFSASLTRSDAPSPMAGSPFSEDDHEDMCSAAETGFGLVTKKPNLVSKLQSAYLATQRRVKNHNLRKRAHIGLARLRDFARTCKSAISRRNMPFLSRYPRSASADGSTSADESVESVRQSYPFRFPQSPKSGRRHTLSSTARTLSPIGENATQSSGDATNHSLSSSQTTM